VSDRMAIIAHMAWEWVGPVATATAGVAGMFFTWLTGKQSRDDARAIAKETRDQQRLENAYIELLDVAERVGHWAQMAFPIMDTNPPKPVPELPDLAQQARAEALIRAFGSDAVLGQMEAWRSVAQQMIVTGELIAMRGVDASVNLTARQKFAVELRPEERRARAALGEQVAIELGQRREPKKITS
jgi:hypothetical protein